MNRTMSIPVVALRGMTVLPEMVVHFDVSRKRSVEAVQEAMTSDQKVFLVTQREMDVEDPEEGDLYRVGTVATIKQIMKLPRQILRVLVSGEERAVLNCVEVSEPYLRGYVTVLDDSGTEIDGEINREAMLRGLTERYIQYAAKNPRVTRDAVEQIRQITDLKTLVSQVAANLPVSYQEIGRAHV